jgi:CheY-like chemotaxis protein
MAGLSVLAVDNDPAALRAMVALLESWGCSVRSARGEDDLPDAGWLAGVDLLVVDYHLDASRTGVQLVVGVRAVAHRTVPAVVVTADGGDALRDDVEAIGAAYLRKPVKPLALRTAVRRVVPARGAPAVSRSA